MNILGIDPGLTRCGVALIESNNQTRHKVAKICTAVVTDKNHSHQKRLEYIYNEVKSVFEKYHIDIVAIERPFFTNHNPNTAFGTAQVVGIIMLLSQQHNANVVLYTPNEIKSTVSGYGKADKSQIRNALMKLFKIEKLPNLADSVDALAIAYTACLKPNVGLTDELTKNLTDAQRIILNQKSKSFDNSRLM